MKTFKFITNNVEYKSIGLKGEREYYVTGYISTDEIDRANEVVTREAMKSMVDQINSGSVKLDIEHSTFTGDNDIPVGKIVDAGIDEKGVWVKCTLNKAHSRFNEYWKSIKNGFLDAFSIAYKPLEIAKDIVNGTTVTFLKAVELLNVAITGNPICRSAKMTESFYKSLKYINENIKSEETEMVEEVKENVPVENENPEVEQEEVVKEEPKEEVKEEVVEEPKKEEAIPEEKEDDKVNPLDMIKSLQKEIAKLKSINEELNCDFKNLSDKVKKPILKSVVSDTSETKEEKIEIKRNPLDFL